MPKYITKHSGVRKISLKRGEVIFEEEPGNEKLKRRSNSVQNGKTVKLSEFAYYIKHDKRGKLLPLLENLIEKNHKYQMYLKERNDTIQELRGKFKEALDRKLERREEVVERRTKKVMKRRYHNKILTMKDRLEIEANEKLFQTGYVGAEMLDGIEKTLFILSKTGSDLFETARERRFAHALSVYNMYQFLYHQEAHLRWKITYWSINLLAKEDYIYIYHSTDAKHGYGSITPKGSAFLDVLYEKLRIIIKSIQNEQARLLKDGRRSTGRISKRIRLANKRRAKVSKGVKPGSIRIGRRPRDTERGQPSGGDIPD